MRQSFQIILGTATLTAMAASMQVSAAHHNHHIAVVEMQITCPDGSDRTCNAADPEEECYDNSLKVCGDILAQTNIVGKKTAVECSDGSNRACNEGTYGCFKNGPVCDIRRGYEKQIKCRDGTTRFCYAGTQHCYDNDETTCGQKDDMMSLAQMDIVGGKIAVPCKDGSVRACQAGTHDCFANGTICNQMVGYETQVSCPDGTKKFCNVGTQHCFKNDPVTCDGHMEENQASILAQTIILGGKTAITCADGSVRTCQAGTYGCAKDGSVCDPNMVGYETQISCPDGSKKYCYAGTRYCGNNDPVTCGASDFDWPANAGIGPVMNPNGDGFLW